MSKTKAKQGQNNGNNMTYGLTVRLAKRLAMRSRRTVSRHAGYGT